MREQIPVERAYRLLHPGPVVLVTAAYKNRANVTVAPWATPVSLTPPLVAVALAPARFTHELITKSEEFVLNIPSLELAQAVKYCASVSGRDVADKFKPAGLTLTSAKAVGAPLIEQCLGHLECGLIEVFELGDHALFIGQVLVAWADTEAFDQEGFVWKLEIPEAKPLHHLGGAFYGVLEKRLEV